VLEPIHLVLDRPADGDPRALVYLAEPVGRPKQVPIAVSPAVDRSMTHRRLAEQIVGHRALPRRCSRCGRGFDALKAGRGGPVTRFVRFGSTSLCGGCVEQLRRLVRGATVAIVEADA
jgi:hypothetical protein